MAELPNGWPESSYFRYQREHLTLRLTTRRLTNHELREILVGLWARLDHEDQEDHIRDLQHYLSGGLGVFLSGIAQQIRDTE
jgi:hypothetical protein